MSLTGIDPRRALEGGDQMPYVSTLGLEAGQTAATLTANQAYLVRVRVAKPLTISTLTFFVGTASGNVDAGIYQSDGTTLTRLAAAGSTAAAGASATQTLTLSAPVTLQPGIDYYIAFAADNATVTIARNSVVNSAIPFRGKRALQYATSFPLPASLVLASGAATVVVNWLFAEP